MKKASDFDSFQSLCRELVILKRSKTNIKREYELNCLLNYIFSQEETNEYWIHKIINFINFSDECCNIKEPILLNREEDGNKTSCLIISKKIENPKLTSKDIMDMKLGIKIPDYIIYDYEIKPDEEMNEYYNKLRSLREVLRSIGLPISIKFFLSEEIMSKLKDKEQKNTSRKKQMLIKKKTEN